VRIADKDRDFVDGLSVVNSPERGMNLGDGGTACAQLGEIDTSGRMLLHNATGRSGGSGHASATASGGKHLPRPPTSVQPTATYFALSRSCVQLFLPPSELLRCGLALGPVELAK